MKHMTLKRILCATLALAMSLSLVACGNSSGDKTPTKPNDNTSQSDGPNYDKTTITIGSYYSRETTPGQAWEEFERYVEEKSGGKVQVDLFHESSIGTEAELALGQQDGSVDLLFSGSTGVGLYVPAVNVFELHFVYGDKYQQMEIYDNVKADLAPAFAEKGYTLLGYFREGPRNYMATFPIETIDDIQGQKFRTPATDLYSSCISGTGANAIALPLSDVYTSLQTGVVVGQEGPLDLAVTQKFYEQCKYVTRSEHVYNLLWITYSQAKWDKLNADTQALIQEGVDVAMKLQQKLWDEKTAKDEAYLIDQGVTFVELKDREKWVAAMEAPNKAFAEAQGELGMKIYEAIQALD